jgi:NAD-dependent dihydropyrimidine dehydrogenase PreA subunit/flavodoxin
MLICYSGTGNSYYASKTIQSEIGGSVVDIARRLDKNNFNLALDLDEPLGIVFPVYFGTIPKAVREYVSKMKISNNGDHYIYAVMTCGSGCGSAPEDLDEVLEDAGYMLDAYYTLIMPNNALVFMDPEDDITVEEKLSAAEDELEAIVKDIEDRRSGAIRTNRGDFHPERSEEMKKAYAAACDTKLFASTDECIGCNFCERLCPERVIKVYGRTAVWEKDSCSLCMGCLDMCPHSAITYDGNKVRGRYHNDSFYLRSIGIAMPFGDKRPDGWI